MVAAEEAVAEEGAAVAAADEGAGDVGVEAAAIVGEEDAAGVRCAIERACADERGEGADGNVGKCGIDGWGERVAGEGFGDGGVEIGVRAGGAEAVAEVGVESDFGAERADTNRS